VVVEGRYQGEWQHDRKHGHGTFSFPNGDRCDCEARFRQECRVVCS